jgi:hypothetical protein
LNRAEDTHRNKVALEQRMHLCYSYIFTQTYILSSASLSTRSILLHTPLTIFQGVCTGIHDKAHFLGINTNVRDVWKQDQIQSNIYGMLTYAIPGIMERQWEEHQSTEGEYC